MLDPVQQSCSVYFYAMWLKSLFGRASPSPPPLMLSEVAIERLVDWSVTCARKHQALLPSYYQSNMTCVTAWYALPVMLGLKHKNISPPIPDAVLDSLDHRIGQAAMTAIFSESANEPELEGVGTSLIPVLRGFIVFWVTAFDDVSKRSTLSDEHLLATMLAGLIENPEFDLQDTFGIDDDEDVVALSKAFATLISNCFKDVTSVE